MEIFLFVHGKIKCDNKIEFFFQKSEREYSYQELQLIYRRLVFNNKIIEHLIEKINKCISKFLHQSNYTAIF